MSVELVTSRDVMAELTRHRLASFCIESQRYVCMNGEIAFILPRFYRKSDEASEFWEFCMSDAEQSYHFLLEKGLKPEDARKILPNSTATHIVMKANIREWRHTNIITYGGDKAGTLDASYYKGAGARNGKEREFIAERKAGRKYIVRRLSTIECARLQG